ncbi:MULTISPECIES: helix-turn-helix domain-containing protein [Protofrankia]|uniref:HTH cro/C1-type domain-containing protein n=1 Tax=Protofrankia coriariae TaxID=1562887 RepID=A0ABR5F171_9ACTN|nr:MULTISPECIES: helix-turn-helix transcriptional regulator [Protofrankia]KLL10464.1 hypothetical protein FrCorBMG51_17995 [Protofrankia coriariae]ONH33036.1 hypothetical protein BL254_20625 [Protofrankia sp. BMG5.30]
MPPLNVRDLGDFIRDQRKAAHISVRQLARQAGVSNPYLSQIERGLRKPSAEILQQIAKALRISAEVLYVQAGILDERASDSDVTAAVLADSTLTERQKQVIVEIYDAFRKENAVYGLTGRPTLPDGLRQGISASPPVSASPPATKTALTGSAPTGSTAPTGLASATATTATEVKPAGTTRRATGATRAAATPTPRAPGASDAAPKRATATRRPRTTAATGGTGKADGGSGDAAPKAGRATGRSTRTTAATNGAAAHDSSDDTSSSTK